jgi:hypothetical protein
MSQIFINNQSSETIKTNTKVSGAELTKLDSESSTGNFSLDAGTTYQVQVNNNGGFWEVAIFEYKS